MTGGQDVEIVEFDDRWESAQASFARRNWPGKVRRASADYLRWEYRGPTSGPVPGLLLAIDGDQVIGQLGAIPGTAMLDQRLRPVQWIGNLMVDGNHRRRGVMSSLFHAAVDRPLVTFGTDPSPSAAATMSKFGFEKQDSSVLMVLPLKAGPVVSARYPQLRRLSRPLAVVGAPIVRYVTRDLRRAQLTSKVRSCSWRDIVSSIRSAEAATNSPRSIHDESFLAWRCSGFAPWHREVEALSTDTGSFAVLESAGSRMIVLQWHGVDEADTAAVMGRTVYVAQSYGMDYLQAMAGTSDEVAQLTALGFRARRTPTELWAYPASSLANEPFIVQGYDTDQNL